VCFQRGVGISSVVGYRQREFNYGLLLGGEQPARVFGSQREERQRRIVGGLGLPQAKSGRMRTRPSERGTGR
jgi:hypothetical protein